MKIVNKAVQLDHNFLQTRHAELTQKCDVMGCFGNFLGLFAANCARVAGSLV